MSGRFDRKGGDNVDGWRLTKPLGAGGNAEVWRAVRSKAEEVALKILRQRNPESEPFRRFQDEIEAMTRIGAHPGVLPLLARSLPERPTRDNPAWIATPVAVPIREALGAEPALRDVVTAVASVADTLAILAEQHGIYHRDLKPENLYRLNGLWCVGDFGLATYPGKDSITASCRLIGPLYYLAPEVFMSGATAPGPTDVYALAKILWVLATGQTYPLPGHLMADVEQFRLSSFTSGDHTRALDLLIARATVPGPTARPTMTDLSAELRAWLSPARSGHTDLPRATLDRVAPLVTERVRAIAERERRTAYVLKRLEEITTSLRPLGDVVARSTGLQPEYGAWSMFTDAPEVKALLPAENMSYQRHAAFHVTVESLYGSQSGRVVLVSGISMTITADGFTHVIGAHVIYNGASVSFTAVTKPTTAPMESAREHGAVADALTALSSTLGSAMDAFADALS